MATPWRKWHLPKNTARRGGAARPSTRFIVAHDTGNPGSTAAGNVSYYHNTANQMSASAHLFVDDKEIVECVPLNEKAWHVLYDRLEDNRMFGDDANDAAIGVELCFGGKIDNKKAYANYVDLIVELLVRYGLQPKHVIGHMHLDPGRKTDPVNSFSRFGKTWKGFIDDIEKDYAARTGAKPKKVSAVKKVVKKVLPKAKPFQIEIVGKSAVAVRTTPDFDAAAHTSVKPGEVYTVVETVKSKQAGHKMYKLKSGLYITTSSKYVKVVKR